MSSPFSLISTAWSFYRKQSILNTIAFWFFFVPMALIDLAEIKLFTHYEEDPMLLVILIPILIVLVYIIIWGQACTLMVAKRLVSSAAGRNRSSFKAVCKQARKYIAAIFLTEILRSVAAFLWGLLLIVPGIIYSIRTIFFDLMMIEEGKVTYGRTMLRKSSAIVKGSTWAIFYRLFMMGVCIFVPMIVVSALLGSLVAIDERLLTLTIVLIDFISAFIAVFFIVCTVALYADLKKQS